MTETDRRSFIVQSAGALVGMALLPDLTMAAPRQDSKRSVAVIGTGRQGRAIIGQLQKIEDRKILDTAHQVIRRVATVLDAGKSPYARVEIETSDEWKSLCDEGSNAACDELLFWLGELLEEL